MTKKKNFFVVTIVPGVDGSCLLCDAKNFIFPRNQPLQTQSISIIEDWFDLYARNRLGYGVWRPARVLSKLACYGGLVRFVRKEQAWRHICGGRTEVCAGVHRGYGVWGPARVLSKLAWKAFVVNILFDN